MVKTRLFGLVFDERHQLPVGDPVLTKAVTFLKEIGIKYAAGEVDRAGLIPMRNAKATSMGLSDTVNVLKKPAASDTTQVTSEVIPRVKRGGPKVQDDGVIDVEDTKSVQQGEEVEAEESEDETDPRSEDEEEANKT